MKHITYILILALFFGCKSENNKVNSESPINGKWKVISSTVLPFEHISYCKKLKLNSVFEFKEDRTLNVYETINGKICTKDQTFRVRGKNLEILEWDMIFDYEIMELTTETLKLKIISIPSYFWTGSDINDEKTKEKLEEISESGIIVTLEKIKSGS